jgi:hypothetical protein
MVIPVMTAIEILRRSVGDATIAALPSVFDNHYLVYLGLFLIFIFTPFYSFWLSFKVIFEKSDGYGFLELHEHIHEHILSKWKQILLLVVTIAYTLFILLAGAGSSV